MTHQDHVNVYATESGRLGLVLRTTNDGSSASGRRYAEDAGRGPRSGA